MPMRERKLKKMFHSIYVHEQFEYDGYVVLPFLPEEQLHEMKRIADAAQPSDTKRAQTILAQALENVFYDCRLFYGGLYANGQANCDDTLLRGSTYTDETRFAAAFLYVAVVNPLELQAVKGSHIFYKDKRPFPSNFSALFSMVLNSIKPYTQTVKVTAGEAFIYHPALIRTTPKTVNNIIELAVVPAEAELFFYTKKGAQFEKHTFKENSFQLANTEFIPNPTANLGKVEFTEVPITKEDFMQKINPVSKKTWKQKISDKLIEMLS